MDKKDVRAAVAKAKYNEQNSNLIFIELFVLAAMLGISFHSRFNGGGWWVFGIALIVLLALSFYRKVQSCMNIGFSLFWGAIAYNIARSLFGSLGAGVVIGVLAFLISFGIHSAGFEWMGDVDS